MARAEGTPAQSGRRVAEHYDRREVRTEVEGLVLDAVDEGWQLDALQAGAAVEGPLAYAFDGRWQLDVTQPVTVLEPAVAHVV